MATVESERTQRYATSNRGDWPYATPRPIHDGRAQWDGRSAVNLLRELSGEAADLARLEIELAKTEMIEKVDVFQRGTKRMIVGGVLLLGAVLTLLWAANLALTALLAQYLEIDVAAWLSPLILGGLLGLIGWAALRSGRREVSEEGITPTRTRESLRQDREFARQKARDVKNELEEERHHG